MTDIRTRLRAAPSGPAGPDPAAEIAHLKKALASRTVIAKAIEILMERHRIGDDEAFTMLVRMSQTSNVKRREVAAGMVSQCAIPLGKAP